MAETIMYKVKKGFILANGFEGTPDQTVSDKELTKKEVASLLKDESIEPLKATFKKPLKPKKK